MPTRNYNLADKIILQLDAAINSICGKQTQSRPNPANEINEIDATNMSVAEKQHSGALMRVNHSGEVCAQALYRGGMLVARSSKTYEFLEQACQEELDHLAWTHQRLEELSCHRSYLNGFWYLNSLIIGMLSGLVSDEWNLGFVEETEHQVTNHLEKHLKRLAPQDERSRKIIEVMRDDEKRHGKLAAAAGAKELPVAVKKLMWLNAKIMTITAYYF